MDIFFYDEVWMQFLINLSRYIDARVSHNGKHSVQVAQWVRSTARKLSYDERGIRGIYWASLLHDIGKIGVPEHVLRKAGPLSTQEWTLMKLHPIVGTNIVKSVRSIAFIAPAIYYHQEKYDGSGYPEGLRGEAIPLEARILCVVDAYDAMTDDRFYRKGRSHQEAIHELRLLGGKHFDPNVVEAFLEVVSPVQPGMPQYC